MSGKLNVLVTGATGKQGGHLVRELLGRGHSIRALTRKPESAGAAALAARGVTIVSGDFEDRYRHHVRRRPWGSRISSIRRWPAPTGRQAFRISTASSRSRR